MKTYKYLIPVRNLLEFLKKELDEETWEKIKKVLKKKKNDYKCRKCGKLLKRLQLNYFFCDSCNIVNYIREDIE